MRYTNVSLPGRQSHFEMDTFSCSDFWLCRLTGNVVGYATVVLPFYLLLLYLRRPGVQDSLETGCCRQLLRLFAFGASAREIPFVEENVAAEISSFFHRNCRTITIPHDVRRFLLLCFCFAGLQSSYLTWGVLQEKIMTRSYGTLAPVRNTNSNEPVGFTLGLQPAEGEMFRDSQFLVLANRLLAFFVSGLIILVQWKSHPRHIAPLYKYSFASLSNIMSSWFQYEALKYISFPTQVLGKASKIIPVMLMGRLVSRKSYACHQYITAALISIGVMAFLMGRATERATGSSIHHVTTTSFSGLVLMAGYLAFDSFTPNWQKSLFQQYHMSSLQMMCGVNCFSSVLALVTELEQGAFGSALAFAIRHPSFLVDVTVVSLTSAVGQLFIFYTIAQFGPVVFTTIMTVRQMLAILLSCFLFGHRLNGIAAVGVVIVFSSIFAQFYLDKRDKKLRKETEGKKLLNGHPV